MQRFTELYLELDATTRTNEKLAALERYFAEVDPRDGAWALAVLSGRKIARAVQSGRLRKWASEESGYPGWLVDECYNAVGDLSETLSLLLPDAQEPTDERLHEVVEQRVLPLGSMAEDAQRELIVQTWRSFGRQERFLFHKLISRSFRVGVSRRLVERALANVAGVDAAVMSHRLLRDWRPTAEDFTQLLDPGEAATDPGQPYPFALAYQLDVEPASLGDPGDWHAERKWDGIRAQLIARKGQVMIWSRGEELVTDTFPEVRAIGEQLDDGWVLDGEILAWEAGRPLAFALLQRRLGRKRVEATLWPDVPIAFMAYDVLEADARDVRDRPLHERRALLDECVKRLLARDASLPVLHSIEVMFDSWDALAAEVAGSRDMGVEGVMLKRLDSPYGVGRTRGDWWKWKVDPLTIDAVLIYAQQGSGRRASLFTDYTFGVWQDGELVPIAKAYSGLTKEEIAEVDRFVRANTTAKRGPIRIVKPELVFELAFEGIAESGRHKSGLALRFPRMSRQRLDKKPQDADSIETVRQVWKAYGR